MKQLYNNIKEVLPFFSVCIETSNRGKTIYRALASLLNQEFLNFECIIVDDNSDDDTLSEIYRFIDSSEYKRTPFSLSVYQNDGSLGGVLNWNNPLKVAKGVYIAGLEGDDFYQNGYLRKAYNFLSENLTIGIYATGSQRALRPKQGLIPPQEYFQYVFQVINIPPPSETIFIRLNKEGVPFFYNTKDYIYAPEMELLLSISDDDWDAFHTSSAEVFREVSTSNTSMTWKFFKDKFYLFDKYRNHRWVSEMLYKKAFSRQVFVAMRRYLVSAFLAKGNPFSIKEGLNLLLQIKKKEFWFLNYIWRLILVLQKIKFFDCYFKIKTKF